MVPPLQLTQVTLGLLKTPSSEGGVKRQWSRRAGGSVPAPRLLKPPLSKGGTTFIERGRKAPKPFSLGETQICS